MRASLLLGPLAGLALAAAALPAAAQVQQNDPDAANASLARQGEIRALQQQRVSDFNTLNMQIQRNVQYRPVEAYPGLVARPRHPGGTLTRAQRGFNTSICTGC